ncbi:glycerophosphodiester phosphodiesterase family protein [Spirosoma jeollabukense]
MKVKLLFLISVLLTSEGMAQSINRFRDSQTIDAFFRYTPARKRPLILAHRGGPGPVDTENSIITFSKTASALPDAILEMDVRMTRDSGYVLLHDATLDRESNAKGPVAERSLAELKSTQLKTLAGELTNQHMPTFADVLAWNQNRYLLALDVKPGTDPIRVMELVKKYKAENAVFVICYSLADAQRVRTTYPKLWLAVGVNSLEDMDHFERSALPKARLIALTPQKLQPVSFYDRLHKLGILSSVGTYGTGQLDEKPIQEAAAGYKEIVRQGGDILTTDRPLEVADLF